MPKKDHIDKIRVDIIQPRIAEYRVPLYYGLLEDPRFDIGIQASESYLGNKSSQGLSGAFDLDHPIIKIPSTTFTWQKNLRPLKVRQKGDVLVVCGDIHQLSNLPVIFNAKRKGIGVLWWGHHRSAGARDARVNLRLMITRWLSDCVLCYTLEGADYLRRRGFDANRVFAAGNTIDSREIDRAVNLWSQPKLDEFRKINKVDGVPLLLFCSVLRPKTELDLLLKALSEACLRKVEWKLVVVGDGVMREPYQKLAERLGVDGRILWLGTMFEQDSLAPWFLSSDCLIYPGSIGLSLLHAFGYGLPVLTHDNKHNHGPEFEALQPEINGLLFKEGDSGDLAKKILRVLESDELRKSLSHHAWLTSHETYTMGRMVENFKAAILGCSRISRMS